MALPPAVSPASDPAAATAAPASSKACSKRSVMVFVAAVVVFRYSLHPCVAVEGYIIGLSIEVGLHAP